MYYLSVANDRAYSSAEIGRMVGETESKGAPLAEIMRHLSAIERIGARGASYSNEDFDVLSAAIRFAWSYCGPSYV